MGHTTYKASDHKLVVGRSGDHRGRIAASTIDACDWLADCPALLLLTADLDAAHVRFDDLPEGSGERFVWLEAGLLTQNVYLSATEQGLGTCIIAGFEDDVMTTACRDLIPKRHGVLGILALGRAST